MFWVCYRKVERRWMTGLKLEILISNLDSSYCWLIDVEIEIELETSLKLINVFSNVQYDKQQKEQVNRLCTRNSRIRTHQTFQ